MPTLNGDYPNVLFVVKSKVNSIDSTGMSIRNWFHDWPRERLGQIYSSIVCEESSFVERGFQLGVNERRFGRIFFVLKSSPLNVAAMPYQRSVLSSYGFLNRLASIVRPVVKKLSFLLINTGLWELLFPPRLSPELKQWIMDFKPDVMFVQGCDISFMRLPLLIKKEFNIPICFDVVDDWVKHLYSETLLATTMQPIVQKEFQALMVASDLCYAIGPSMSSEYTQRYGVDFKILMQCADHLRYPVRLPKASESWKEINIVYSGSLGLNRWQGIMDLSKAAEILVLKGFNVMINVYAPYVPDEAQQLRLAFSVRLYDALPDDEMPALLTSADILFLPESFDLNFREYIKFSISTKAHLYMMSGQVSLVYGPVEVGTVDYARKSGWAYVVDQPSSELLSEAVYSIATDANMRRALIDAAKTTAMDNHAEKVVRKKLKDDLCRLVVKNMGEI